MKQSWWRKCLKFVVRVGSAVALFILAVWFILSQPTFASQSPATVTADAAKLRAHVEKLAVEFHPRNYEQMDNLNRCADYIAQHFKDAGGRVTEQTLDVNGRIYRNVSAFFGPKTGARWIVGAHYDSCEDTPGADDNASGVAGLLELARMLGSNPPSYAVELVTWPLEEPPFFSTSNMGSARHAESLDQAKHPVRGMIALEMIGYYRDDFGSQDYPSPMLTAIYPNTGNFLAVIGNWEQRDFVQQVKTGMKGATDLPIESIAAPPTIPGIDFSDHRNYWPLGIPAVMVTDTAFYRNPHYHELTDTPDTLDYDRMAKAVTAVYSALGNVPLSD
ncbi:M28 family peptidase [Cerasicoccus maritimus]|uniref:M28 family peptidase n=1 Tax=Cerasicoccus maritimus TaxID=490089 RepID=UPI0028525891|nr:M28 family peptidase [Cerasicoccus maritimus]